MNEIEVMIPKTDVGVIIARFQTPKLTEAHTKCIEFVRQRHKKVAILLGISPTIGTSKNPLDFTTRIRMIQNVYYTVVVLPIHDVYSDEIWSKNVDNLLRTVYPIESISLYGGRNSFIDRYSGKFPTIELSEYKLSLSGSEMRKEAEQQTLASEDFRTGICYSVVNRFPIVYPTIDAAIFNDIGEILLAKKVGELKYRFVGGYVDRIDVDLETAVRREVQEETGATVDNVKYVASFKIDDWRYKETRDSIMTMLFRCKYIYGHIEPNDDIDELKYFSFVPEIRDCIIPIHVPLFEKLFESHTLYNTLKGI
jgi:bifunctional NMN adenylyltransferase/nudix hydrolase